MSSDPHVEACLRALRALSDALEADLVALSPAEWDRPTNCPPWRVRDIVAHVVVSGEGFAASIRQGLAGSVETGVSTAARERRQAEIETAEPVTVARALRSVTDDFIGLYTDLQDQELATICFHRRGNRSIRWYAAHRLAEVAFHHWDVQFSLGRDPRLDEPVAALLLPTLLESNAPRIYAAGLDPAAWKWRTLSANCRRRPRRTLADSNRSRSTRSPSRRCIRGPDYCPAQRQPWRCWCMAEAS